DPQDQWCRWIHQRDALWLIQWGRLGYDPKTAEDVFERAIDQHLGSASYLSKQWKTASSIVPTAFTALSFGPDHRDHAPELEWGGTTDEFIQAEPFDSHVFMSAKERLAIDETDGHDGREVFDVSSRAFPDDVSMDAVGLPIADGAEGEVGAAIVMMSALGAYTQLRAEAASVAALAESKASIASGEEDQKDIDLDRECAARMLKLSADSWWTLSASPASRFYRPFTDRLRMGTNQFHWSGQLQRVLEESRRFDATPRHVVIDHYTPNYAPLSAGSAELKWTISPVGTLHCEVAVKDSRLEGGRSAWLLEKPLPSSTFFHKHPMRHEGDRFVLDIPRAASGNAIAAEVDIELGGIGRFPRWTEGRPYLVVPATTGPTPQYYSSQEALKFLKPESLDPGKHGALFIATRAWDFHRSFDVSQQRKILDAVRRGMKLLVLQQDYTSGRYPLDWYPKRPKIENAPSNVFDPAGALGLEKVETDDVLYQPIRASEGWEVFGNGGIARCKVGEGEIWLCQARLMQRMHIPGCARNLKKLLELGGREKPTVVIDAGSEGNRYSTSVFCDFMNAHEIPFLTLGEVIVEEQGMDSFEVVKGPISPDRVLEGRGGRMVGDWLAEKIREKCNQPLPASVSSLKTERARRKTEFMRSLGLDPLPPRTPLEARVTGKLERDGYTIEKLVFESRPNFPVTAHLYVPSGRAGERLPVIVNATGHWPHKKTEPTEQMRLISQARAGYLAIEVDSPGHSYEGDARVERREAGSHFDPRMIAGSTTADAVYVWDLMRAVDYLATRPEADMARVGITGVSGGGHATMFAFAADERFRCAVPVCYPTSFLDGWNNGCDCNHVPGYLQVGDRADVIAIRAPAPVFVIGARDDQEFPPLGTQHTGERLKATWRLLDAEKDAWWSLFDGGHDYSKPMREAAMGFFDLHLRNTGDGSPVPEAEIATEPPEAAELFCLSDPPVAQLTMRDIARANVERAGNASWADVVALNGGLPRRVPFDEQRLIGAPEEPGQPITFQSEKGITIPGLLYQPRAARAAVVFVSEGGKLAARDDFPIDALVADGIACLAIDVRGFGELPGLDPHLMSYLGIADSFAMGWDAARAAEWMLQISPRVAVVGKGTCGSLVALYAGLIEPRVSLVVGIDALERWSEVFDDDVPTCAVQPRVMYGATIEHLRAQLGRPVEWRARKAPALDLSVLLARTL
ncbi:MAG: acetylxylan esterase, partial [Planctomycetota bacterium]